MKKLRNFYQWYINLPTGRRLGVSFVLHFSYWLLIQYIIDAFSPEENYSLIQNVLQAGFMAIFFVLVNNWGTIRGLFKKTGSKQGRQEW